MLWRGILVPIPWLIGIVGLLLVYWIDVGAASRERSAAGIVLGHRLSHGDDWHYKFQAQGQWYTDWDVGNDKPLRIGGPVTVYYDGGDPDRSALQHFSDLADSHLGVAGGISILTLIVVFAFWLSRRGQTATPRQG